MAVNLAKLQNLILYIGGNPYVQNLGITKLWKLIYFIEATALRELGQTITGSDFIKYDHGPVPSRGDKALKQLQRDRRIHTHPEQVGQYRINKISVDGPVDTSSFSVQEIELIDRLCRTYGGKNASFLSELSHQEPAWIYAQKLDKLSPDLMLYGFAEDLEGL